MTGMSGKLTTAVETYLDHLPHQCADRLAGVLARVADTRRLGEVRDWIGDCATGEALMARLGNGAGSGL